MPRFHFNIYDGVSEIDRDGTDLLDRQTARVEAVQLAGAILTDDARRIALGGGWHMEVTDGRGLIVFSLDLVAAAPASPDGVRAP